MDIQELDPFTLSYIDVMLFYEGETLKDADMTKISESLMQQIVKDCQDFQEKANHLITPENCLSIISTAEVCAGRDFWLTRNFYSIGFWNYSWDTVSGKALTKLARSYGKFDVRLGADGFIYSR